MLFLLNRLLISYIVLQLTAKHPWLSHVRGRSSPHISKGINVRVRLGCISMPLDMALEFVESKPIMRRHGAFGQLCILSLLVILYKPSEEQLLPITLLNLGLPAVFPLPLPCCTKPLYSNFFFFTL